MNFLKAPLLITSSACLSIALFGSEPDPSNSKESSQSSSSNEEKSDIAPSIAEITIQIANDPGAGFGGDR